MLGNEGVQTHNGVLEREKADLERRAERFAHRVEEERALKEKERLAHESRVRAIRTQVCTTGQKMTGDTGGDFFPPVLMITKPTPSFFLSLWLQQIMSRARVLGERPAVLTDKAFHLSDLCCSGRRNS